MRNLQTKQYVERHIYLWFFFFYLLSTVLLCLWQLLKHSSFQHIGEILKGNEPLINSGRTRKPQ